MMTRRNNRPKMVNIAVPESLHLKILELSKLFHIGIGETTEYICKNGIKNIIDIMVLRYEAKITKLKEFSELDILGE